MNTEQRFYHSQSLGMSSLTTDDGVRYVMDWWIVGNGHNEAGYVYLPNKAGTGGEIHYDDGCVFQD